MTHKQATIIYRRDPNPLNNRSDAEVFADLATYARDHGLLDAKVDVHTLNTAVHA